MSTSFKSFQSLNQSLTECYETKKVASINTALDALSSVVYAAESVASEYAGLYSQVQWMKYSQEGDPDDVTPSQQLSIPDSIISKLKALVKKADAIYESINPGNQIVAPGPDAIYFQIADQAQFVYKFLKTGGVVTEPYNPANNNCIFSRLQQSVVIPVNQYLTVTVRDPAFQRSIGGGQTYLCEMCTVDFHGSSLVTWCIKDSSTNVPYMAAAWSSGSDKMIISVLNSDDITYTHLETSGASLASNRDDIPSYCIYELAAQSGPNFSVSLTSSPINNVGPVQWARPSGNAGAYQNVTIATDIDPDTLYNGYSNLKSAIQSL